jgi:hypothetical protein
MSHITERIAEFVFEELSTLEMTKAQRHVAQCAECREQVERFQQTLAILKTSPMLDPPRNIVFEVEKRRTQRMWTWVPAMAAIAALLLITVALLGRVHVQWQDSQMTIAFGELKQEPDADHTDLAAEIQRLQGHIAYLEERQTRAERDAVYTASTVQLLAHGQRVPTGD